MIHGHTSIELMDAETGEVVDSVEDDNMVTNLIQDILTLNPGGLNYRSNVESFVFASVDNSISEYMLPICPKLTGGIFLFHETLDTSSPKDYYPPHDNLPFAYASTSVNTTENPARGSYNSTESGPITNGYKYVWDFATNQGNGVIKAVGLTHPNAGLCGFGDTYSSTTPVIKVKNIRHSATERKDILDIIYIIELNWEENYAITITTNEHGIVVKKLHWTLTKIGLKDGLNQNNLQVLHWELLVPQKFPLMDSNSCFMDGGNGYWYGFQNKGSSTAPIKVTWIKISKADYSFTEGEWSLPIAGSRIGATDYDDTSSIENLVYRVNSVIRNGYLYLPSYALTTVYKINLNNPTDITSIEVTKASSNITSDSYKQRYLLLIGNIIYSSAYAILEDDTVIPGYKSYSNITNLSTPLFEYGPYLLGIGYEYTTLYVHCPFLVTKNNLRKTLEKTAEHTMKITYTLTEE